MSKISRFVDDFANSITPTEADMEHLIKPTAWISKRLLSYRSYETIYLEGKQVFSKVILGGSTERKTAIRPVHDVDLVVFKEDCDDGLMTTFEHVLGALSAGSASVVHMGFEVAPLNSLGRIYCITLADEQHPEAYRKFVFRWQRHSFGICFGEVWDDSKTTFDIVPVFLENGSLYLKARFSHNQEANPFSLSEIKSDAVNDDRLLEAIRVFKAWNKRHANSNSSCPFASYELEGAISLFWSLNPDISASDCSAHRIVMLFKELYLHLGRQFRIPGLLEDQGAYILLGSGNSSWNKIEVKELVRRDGQLLGSAYYHPTEADTAERIWKHVFRNELLPDSEMTYIFPEPYWEGGVDGQLVLHLAPQKELPLNAIVEVMNRVMEAQDLNAVDSPGRTAIYLAAGLGRSDADNILLQACAKSGHGKQL